MAHQSGALAQTQRQVHSLRNALRRADRNLAALAGGDSIVVDADGLDEETEDQILALIEAVCAANVGSTIEIIVIAQEAQTS